MRDSFVLVDLQRNTEEVASQAQWQALSHHWLALFDGCRADPREVARILLVLADRYREPQRVHHRLSRVHAMIREAARLYPHFAEPDVIGFAIWFHAAVYDPAARDNAEQSARFAQQTLQDLGIAQGKVARVTAAIAATRDHQPIDDSYDHRAFLDLHLSFLGADQANYDRYREAVRAEYAWVPDALYRAGRRRMCLGYLARPRMFLTTMMRRRFEERARANLQAELAAL